MKSKRNEDEYQRAMASVDNQILGIYICIKEAIYVYFYTYVKIYIYINK
jgi:hypothetical protein